jgi:hypothetical protein
MVMHHDVTPPPRFPRAPTQAAWEAMSEAQRRAVVDALPGTMTEAELHPPEGDSHFDAKSEGRETLRTHLEVMGELIMRDKNHPSVIMWSAANVPYSEAPCASTYLKH